MEPLILNRLALHLQMMQRRDNFGLHAQTIQDINKSFRHAAYRAYIYWIFGRLGAGNRQVVPSCVVRRIRETFPDPAGHYTGYMPNRLM